MSKTKEKSISSAKIQKEKIENLAKSRNLVKTKDVVALLGKSRQYAKLLINDLITDGKLIKIGSTRSSFYIIPEYAVKHLELFPSKIVKNLRNDGLEEYKVLDDVENHLPLILKLKENVRDIFAYAFSEMLNNAVEHSLSKKINIEVLLQNKKIKFRVSDSGVGVFRNVMEKRNLKSELEAIQELLKGKTTTMPKSHSGQGIFFTSKIADVFLLNSFNTRLVINNKTNEVFVQKTERVKRGTEVTFTIETESQKHMSSMFRKFAVTDAEGLLGFDKTEIKIKLYTTGGICVSRSQARRILTNLEKFKLIVFDFDKVPMIGQAFADEIFRVFQNKCPKIKLVTINTNDSVKFMIDRVEGRNPRTPNLFGDSYSA